MSGQWTWSFFSKKDPRFAGSGTAFSMMACAEAIDRAIGALEKTLGVKAPDDIETQGNKE